MLRVVPRLTIFIAGISVAAVFTAALCAIPNSVTAAPTAASNKATKFTIKTGGSGKMQLFVDKSGRTRFDALMGTVVDPGNHQSYGYSEASEKFVHYATPEAFSKSNFCKTMGTLSRNFTGTPWKKCGTTVLFGFPSTTYCRTTNFGLEKLYLTTALPIDYRWVQHYFLVSGGDVCPKGLPLRNEIVHSKGEVELVMGCVKVENVNVVSDFFDVPKGYQEVNDDWQVYLGAADDLIWMDHSPATRKPSTSSHP